MFKRSVVYSLLILSCGFLFAEAEDVEAHIEEHISVGSREMDPELKELTHKRRLDSNENPASAKKTALKTTSTQPEFSLASPQVHSRSIHPASYAPFPIPSHYLYTIADDDLSIELEDGSHWETAYSDIYTLRTWRPGDLLKVTPDTSWFSSYDYYIFNKSNNTHVKANLKVGPLAFGASSNWIIDIDYLGGHVYLQNGVIWCVNPKDEYLIRQWAINDHIILGTNDSIWAYYPHILINVNMNEYVRAKQY